MLNNIIVDYNVMFQKVKRSVLLMFRKLQLVMNRTESCTHARFFKIQYWQNCHTGRMLQIPILILFCLNRGEFSHSISLSQDESYFKITTLNYFVSLYEKGCSNFKNISGNGTELSAEIGHVSIVDLMIQLNYLSLCLAFPFSFVLWFRLRLFTLSLLTSTYIQVYNIHWENLIVYIATCPFILLSVICFCFL